MLLFGMSERPRERWLPVAEFKGRYEVSSLGRVRSVRGHRAGTIMRVVRRGVVDPRVVLKRGPATKNVKLNTVVLVAFRGTCPDGEWAVHRDGDRGNCSLDNLSWGGSDIGGERWRPAPGFEELYDVSDAGRVRSKRRSRAGAVLVPNLTGGADNHAYPTVHLCRSGGVYSRRIHRLVAGAFIGPPPDGMECRHLNGDPTDNRVENLAWGTRTDNMRDAIRHGTTARGESNGNAKINALDVLDIRFLYRAGVPHTKLQAWFGLGRRQVQRIASGQRWGHVPWPKWMDR